MYLEEQNKRDIVMGTPSLFVLDILLIFCCVSCVRKNNAFLGLGFFGVLLSFIL